MIVHEIAALIEQSNTELLRHARRLARDDHEALDLYQEAVLRAVEHMDEIRDHQKIVAWLKTTMRNLAFTEARKAEVVSLPAHELLGVAESEELGRGTDFPQDRADDWVAQARAELAGVVPKLTPAMGEFVTAILQWKTPGEVCLALDITPHTFRAYLSRLRASLVEFSVISTGFSGRQGYLPQTYLPVNDPGHALHSSFKEAVYLVQQSLLRGERRGGPRLRPTERLATVTDAVIRERYEVLLACSSLLYLLHVNMLVQ
jgi:RNA polymerase sigma factor (sigma-70 family)